MGSLASSLSDLLVESVLRRADVLLVGDPEVLAHVELPPEAGIVPTPAGNAVVVHNPGASAFVWVAGSPDGPVRELTAALRLDALEREPALFGYIDCPSGRVVVGTPDAVAAWGDDIEPDDGLFAQARAYSPGRRHRGLIVVAQVESGRHRVLVAAGAEGIEALVVACISPATSAEFVAEPVGVSELLIAS
jgi:hypothetical protein